MKTVTYTVPNISCQHCVHTIRMELTDEMPGVKSVEGDPALKQVTIHYNDPATQSAIEALMAQIDYTVQK
ncbi:MAG: heavy-metal-associated domain-containing protein [Chloroflexi bacterium]|nr:heavy-metal-associated domain-containing protein [Chloroflexota bacterium]